MHIDHVIPLAEGGTNALSNLQLLCAKCNLAKGKKTGHYDESDVLGTAGELAASDNGA
jgi:5-methylcytosine-specific restriction endonuclease McrA